MADNQSKRGKRDQVQLAAGQDYEVNYLMQEAGITRERALELFQKHGGNRKKIRQALGKGKV